MVITRRLVDDQGRFLAVLAGQLELNALKDIMLEHNGMGTSGETYLVSAENNHLLTPSRFAYPLDRAYRSIGIDRALRRENGAGIYLDYRDPPVQVLGVYRWIPELQAGLLAEADLAEALMKNNRVQMFGIFLASVATLIAVLVGLYTATRLSRPLMGLTQVATQITHGHLHHRADVTQRNEIGVLAAAFNTMTDRLQQTLIGLEQRVAERTAELEQTVSELRTSIQQRDVLNATVRELSSPVIPIQEGVLVMPLIGVIDAERAAHIMQVLLAAIKQQHARIVILDVTGLPFIDTQVARGLLAAAEAARLLGAQIVLVGIRPELAQTIVGLGLDLTHLVTRADLQSGIRYAMMQPIH